MQRSKNLLGYSLQDNIRLIFIQISTRNGRVSFRCTGNETLSTLNSTALMTLPVPTNWCTRVLRI